MIFEYFLRSIPHMNLRIKILKLYNTSNVPPGNFGTLVGLNSSSYVILALRAVNGLSIVCWGNGKKAFLSPNPFKGASQCDKFKMS